MEGIDWPAILKDNFSAILVLIGTLFGTFVGFLSGIFAFSRERRLRREQWHKEYRQECSNINDMADWLGYNIK